MKPFILVIPLAFLLFLVPAAAADKPQQPTDEKSKVSTEDVKRESKEALEATKTNTLQKKEEYQKKATTELARLRDWIRDLEDKVKRAGAESKAFFNKAMAELDRQREAARKKLDELKSASAEAWEKLRAGMDAALEDLKKSYDELRSRFQDSQNT